MDLGIQIEPQFGFTFEDIVAIAQDAEVLGYRALWLSDHLFLSPDSASTNCLEAWSTLAALAARTRTLRLGAMVTSQSYRNPALLAKIAAGVDHISGGRLEFGIGAGWKEVEYRAYGYPFPSARDRVDQLVEALEICTRMWTQDRATFHGRHYRIDDALCAPKPVQSPLPIWIGGRRPRILRIAAQWAHAMNWLPEGGFPTPEQTRGGMRDVEAACAAENRDPSTLRRSVFLYAIVGRDDAAAEAIVDEVAGKAKLDAKTWRERRPGAMIGSPKRVGALLREHEAAGAQDANVMFPYGYEREMAPLLLEAAGAM